MRKKPQDRNPVKSAGWMLKVINSWIDREHGRQMKAVGLSRAQFPIMMVLLEEEGLTQVEIGERIPIPGYATSRNLDQLENKNLVKRQPHETSRRSHRVYLTPEGKRLASTLPSVAKNISEQLVAPLRDDERELLLELLEQVVRSVVWKQDEPEN